MSVSNLNSDLHLQEKNVKQIENNYPVVNFDVDILRNNLINLTICSVKTYGLLDTGAEISIITTGFLNANLNRKHLKVYNPVRSYAIAVSGLQVKLLGKVFLHTNISNHNFTICFHIVNDENARVIIGADFLNEHRAIINCAKTEIKFALSEQDLFSE